MTDPKFVEQADVTSRFEGEFPDDRLGWVDVRILDVENALMGLVPSLRKPVADITADSAARGDPGRLDRVTTLVADKVLDLFRNPDPRVAQVSQTMEQDTVSRSYARDSARAGSVISFTEAELDSVRLRPKRRSKIGSIPVDPWRITCS
jgi:hypothetical protein